MDFIKRYNKNEATLYLGKYNPDVAHIDQ